MTATPFNVALIGYGYAGRVFHAPLIEAETALHLKLIASSRKEDVLKTFPAIHVVADPIEACTHPDIDIVVIATPNDTHATLTELALQAGKHVVVDKPFTLNASLARRLAKLAQKQGKLLSVFQNRRWDSDFLAIYEAIRTKQMGHLAEFISEMSRFRPVVRERWREQDVPGGGLWYDLAPHLLDQACVLFGLPQKIQADIAILRPQGLSADWFTATLIYPTHKVTLKASMLAADPATRFCARGDKATLVKPKGDIQERQLLANLSPLTPEWGQDDDPLLVYTEKTVEKIQPPAGDYKIYYRKLAQALQADISEAPVLPDQATSLMTLIDAGLSSAAMGKTLPLTFIEEEQQSWDRVYPY